MGTYKAFPLEGKVGPKDPDEGEPATGSGRLAPPRFVRILKGSVVNICLPRHRILVIGERLYKRPQKSQARRIPRLFQKVSGGVGALFKAPPR